MTDPDVGRIDLRGRPHRKPERKEFAHLLERRLHYLYQTSPNRSDYRVLPGVEELLPSWSARVTCWGS